MSKPTQLTTSQFIDVVTADDKTIPENVALKKLETEEEEKKELRKKLKSHHKMLSDKADDCYEKDNKELGRKYREMAKKLADDMENEGAELSLSNYEIDEAALSNPQLTEMQQLKKDLEAQMAELQKSLTETMIAQLSAGNNKPVKLSDTEKVTALSKLLDDAKDLLGDK